ncbi:MAG: polyprenyl synthetase family protein [Pseudobdellovibrionaceae bacterium]
MNNQDRKEWVDDAVDRLIETWQIPQIQGILKLKESVTYSFSRGGKRFRPVLSLLLAESFAVHPQKVLPWALAVEMIHTYSLIHDDLPCMDNDDFRRGEPTNHKVFGETTALLSGDALLTQAFGHLAVSYRDEAALGLKLIALLSEASGIFGMVGGQAIDLEFQKQKPSLEELKLMHEMKTGALIRVSVEGAAIICGLSGAKIQTCRQLGEAIGLAFQIKDDLLDAAEKTEVGSFPAVVGLQQTKEILSDLTLQAKKLLSQLGISEGPLIELVQSNFDREK